MIPRLAEMLSRRCPACGWVAEPYAVTLERMWGAPEHNHPPDGDTA